MNKARPAWLENSPIGPLSLLRFNDSWMLNTLLEPRMRVTLKECWRLANKSRLTAAW
jgi:hypothetical protein